MQQVEPIFSVQNPLTGFYLDQEELRGIEKKYNAKFLGNFWLLRRDGSNDTRYSQPMDFFYTLNRSKLPINGKSSYFGVYKTQDGQTWFIDAMGTFDKPIKGILDEQDNIHIPLYKEDLVFIEVKKIIELKMLMGDLIPIGETEVVLPSEDKDKL